MGRGFWKRADAHTPHCGPRSARHADRAKRSLPRVSGSFFAGVESYWRPIGGLFRTNGALMDTVFNKVKAMPDETLLQVLRAPQPEKLSPRLRRTCAPSLQRPLTINDQDLSHGKAYAAIAIAVTLAIVVQSGPVGSQPAEGDINPVIAFRSTMMTTSQHFWTCSCACNPRLRYLRRRSGDGIDFLAKGTTCFPGFAVPVATPQRAPGLYPDQDAPTRHNRGISER